MGVSMRREYDSRGVGDGVRAPAGNLTPTAIILQLFRLMREVVRG